MSEQITSAPEKPHPLFDPTQDLAPTTPLEAVQIRDIASNGADTMQRTLIKMQEDASAMSRWILASLLAMNTGGAVAIASASDVVEGPIGAPLVAFAIGASLAIGTGINALVTGLRVGPLMGDVIERLRLSTFEGTIHAATRQRILEMGPILRQQLMISATLASGSLAAFGTGVWAAVA